MRGLRGLTTALFVLCAAAQAFAAPTPAPAPAPPVPPPAPPMPQPDQPAAPAAEPDFAKATELYNAASQAMNESRFDDASRDFLAAYEITKDAVLFFKIGTAYEKAGKCSAALGYYERYLAEAKPADNFATLTRERIDACKATLPQKSAETAPAAATPEPSATDIKPSKNKDRAWLFVGGSLAFATAGAVLAYSTASSEQDVKDLYVSNNGKPPEFDAETKERYDDLIAEGKRYQVLAWTSFGIAAGCAIGATIYFLRARNEDITVAPVVTPKETGVSATLRF
ncbi:MAG TPA: hypothetical protein VFV99_00930 [Kofleriaceae bacterium]|nr:hypothetical protein [Kofleriaceae bacterium]